MSARPAFRFLVIALVIGLAACSSPEERAARYLEEGQAFLADNDLDRARVSFRNVLRIEPRNAAALFGMGRIHEANERYDQAFAAYRAAAEADPANLEAHNAYAVLALSGGAIDVVRDAVVSIREVDPEHADGLALAAALALREDRPDAAAELAARALVQAPGHVNATSALAGAANARGDVAAAVAVIDESFAAHGHNVPLSLLKIQLLASTGDTDAVADAFRALVAFDPTNAAFRLAFADFYRSVGDTASAESMLRGAVGDLDTDATAAAALVRLVRETKGVDAALAEVDALTAAAPDAHAPLAFLAADMLVAEARFEEATTRLEAVAAAEDVNSSSALDAGAALAAVDVARGAPDAGRERLDAVLEADPGHRGANYLRGVLDLQSGAVDEAVAGARAALRRDPDWLPGLKLLAEAHAAADSPDLAIEALRRAVQTAPRDVEVASALAELLTQRGDLDAAVRIWDLVINQSADPGDALSATAEIAISQADWARANTDIDRLLETPGAELNGTLLAGSLRLAQDDIEGARSWFERAQAMAPDAAAPLLGLVRTYVAEDDLDGALARLADRVAAHPDDALALSLTAQLYARAERFDEAIAAYRAVIDAAPTWATPYIELAGVLEQQGQVDEALHTLGRGIDASGDAGGDLRIARAFVEQRAERFDAAIATYGQLIAEGDERDLVVNNYAALVADFAFDDPKRLGEAVALAQRFEVSTEAYYLDTLGWLYYRAGEPQRAIPYLRRAAAMMPDDPQIRYHLGASLASVGETERARGELLRALRQDAAYPGVVHASSLLDELEAEAAAAAAATSDPS